MVNIVNSERRFLRVMVVISLKKKKKTRIFDILWIIKHSAILILITQFWI